MFNEFRLSFLRELVSEGFDDEAMRRVMGVVDRMGAEFEMNRKETAIVPINMAGPRMLMEYLACRALEGLSRETLRNYRLALIRFLSAMHKPMDKIETNDIRQYLYQYQRERGISNRSLDKIRDVLNSFFKWAAAEGRLECNPCAAIKPIKYTAKPKEALTQLELEYIRRACGDIRDKVIVELLYSTGCRVSELCGMKRADVDWDKRTVQVLGKGSKYRTCFLNAKSYVTLREYLNRRSDNDAHLIVSDRNPHTGLTRYAVEHIVSEISDRAFRKTGKRITPHIFRHTTATTAIQNGMPVQNVSKMLGHERIETTMIYAEVNATDVQRDHMRYVV